MLVQEPQSRVGNDGFLDSRWKLTTENLASTANKLLYNVLLFPDGWLAGAKDCDHLRRTILPEITFLLCSVLSESEMHEKCVQLADLIAAEKHCLYKVNVAKY